MRPFVLSIAGFDPSGGAGVLADIKTFESVGVQGFGVCTAITYQRDDHVADIDWLSAERIIRQIDVLMEKFEIPFCKIGLIESIQSLSQVLDYLRQKSVQVILDPILVTSSGFGIHHQPKALVPQLKDVFLLTPNFNEMNAIFDGQVKGEALKSVLDTTHIFLKGGHHPKRLGTDYLFTKEKAFPYAPKKGNYSTKHGSGCILSAAITAYLAQGNDLKTACFKGKEYVSNALQSNESLLAYHNLSMT